MLPQKPFYLIRHGQSEANAAQIAAGGDIDSPLTELGKQQAQSLTNVIKFLHPVPGQIYHSHMQRARDTAFIINETYNLQMNAHPDIYEHRMGEWEGKTWDEVHPQLEKKIDPPGGETIAEFADRIKLSFTEIIEKEDKPPLIVAHGGIFHAIGAIYKYNVTTINNCHIHLFEPHPNSEIFPWQVWQFDIEDGRLTKKPAAFCPSQLVSP